MMYECLYTLSAHGFVITVCHGLNGLFSIVIFHGSPNCQIKVFPCYMGNDFKVCTFIRLHYAVCNVCLAPREPLTSFADQQAICNNIQASLKDSLSSI